MKAILINSKLRTISEVDHDDTLESIYKLIECSCIDSLRFNNGDSLFVDDEGLLHNPQYFFIFRDNPLRPLAGNGLIVGCDEEGYDIDCKTKLEDIVKRISFLSLYEVQLLIGK